MRASKYNIPPLVLDLLREVHERTKHGQPPYYADATTLGIAAPTIKIEAAITLAEIEGWLLLAGKPTHLLAITPTGIDQIRS